LRETNARSRKQELKYGDRWIHVESSSCFYCCNPVRTSHQLACFVTTFLTVRLGLVSPHQAPLQAQRIKEKHETVKMLNQLLCNLSSSLSPPNQATCLASAALTMAQTPLNAVCAVTLVWNVFSVLYFTSARSGQSSARTFLLVIIPYVVFFICAGSVAAVGLIHPELVGRATFYCVVHSDVL
jgi:hypothetical protein